MGEQGELPGGTVTLLLADVEGSTRMWQERPDEMPTAMSGLNTIVDELVARHGGGRPLEQGEGDSFVAGFARASDAIACALALQLRIAGGSLKLRIGLHTGDVDLNGRRYDGPTIIRAARLRDLAHGGQIIVSSATRDLTQDSLTAGAHYEDLGSHRLKGLDRAERVAQLTHPDLLIRFPPLRSEVRTGTLPIQLTTFVGRSQEVAEAKRAIRRNRLVTLTGAGGCGKTRLALESVSQLDDAFGDAWFCDLAPLADPTLVGQAVREELGFDEVAGRSEIDVLCEHLGGSDVLILIDNCEHLVEATATLADALLRSCPNVHLVATSREPLGVAGEVAWRVPSMQGEDALALFADRAQRVQPGFVLSDATTPIVVEICARLDGIPLAIELAAARLRVLSLQQIADGLHDRFKLLGRGARTVLARQQTLLASVGWSYDLLSDEQRIALRRLSVFAGGFDLSAASTVIGDERVDRSTVLDVVSELVDRSLVVADETTSPTRYRLLETIRQFARDRLVDAGEAAHIASKHLAHYADRVRDLLLGLAVRRVTQSDVAAAIHIDYDNIRAAAEWAITDAQPVQGIRLGSMLSQLGFTQGHPARVRELAAWLESYLTADLTPKRRLRGLTAVMWVMGLERSADAIAAGEEAIEIARDLGDVQMEGLTTVMTGFFVSVADRGEVGRQLIRDGLVLAERAGDLWTQQLGWTFQVQAHYGFCGPPALTAARRSLELAAATGTGADQAHLVLGLALLSVGQVAQARVELLRAREIFIEQGNLSWVAKSAGILGMIAALQGDHDTALELLAASDAQTLQLQGDVSHITGAMSYGAALISLGRFDEGEATLHRARGAMSRFPDGPVRDSFFAHTGSALALAVAARGRTDEAADAVAELTLTGPEGWPVMCGPACTVSAHIARGARRPHDAERYAIAGLELVRERGALVLAPELLEIFAVLCADAGADFDAARTHGAVEAARSTMGVARQSSPIFDAEAEIALLRDRMATEEFEEAWDDGRRMSVEGVLDLVLRGRGPRQRPKIGWESLTPTELKVVDLVAEGLTNPQIGEKLFMSKRTVSTHVSNVFAKLGIASRSELAAHAAKRG